MRFFDLRLLAGFALFRTAVMTLIFSGLLVGAVAAQSFRFSEIQVNGNRRIETPTIIALSGIERGASLSAGEVNEAIQRIRASGLFETVNADVRGGRLILDVVEFPTVNVIAFEGNKRIADVQLQALVRSVPRRVYSKQIVQEDAQRIAQAYANEGRLTANVTPRIIRRTENRVDVVYEIVEGGVVEIERISFVGNRSFSDRRLRRILQTKQAGLLRLFISSDTFVEDRIDFDKQVLKDFYQSRGYVDFDVLNVNAQLTNQQDAFLLTFRVREGQQFSFGDISVSSDIADVDPAEFENELRLKTGRTYSPNDVDTAIDRLEVLALRKGLDFIRVAPRVSRNDAELTLDVDFVITRGPRVFVERIDIEGNTTTLDRVVRRQFNTVEGDPFNPREIRAAAERIRALGLFANADVEAREGSSESQVVVDVDVQEKPTGSLNFGANFNSTNGVGLIANYSESNLRGRGQSLSFGLRTGETSRALSFDFTEPALLGRDVSFSLDFGYVFTDGENSLIATESLRLRPSIGFPIGENSRLQLSAFGTSQRITEVNTSVGVLLNEKAAGRQTSYGLGYTYSFDNGRTGLDPKVRTRLRFGQDFSVAGNSKFVKTTVFGGVETKVLGEDLTLVAEVEAGALHYSEGISTVSDRFFTSPNQFRGFSPKGIGPRQTSGTDSEALGGNYYAVARFEALFPIGFPEEYGMSGGAFFDIGSVWGLDDSTTAGQTGIVGKDATLRSSIGLSFFWATPIGPLRFNFSRPVESESFDSPENFDLTISTRF